MKTIIIICILFIFTDSVLASKTNEQEFYFESFSTQNGLTQNSGYACVQDNYGYIWLATQDGLCRYDGLNFKKYFKQNAFTKGSMPSGFIQTLTYDEPEHVLWIGTPEGLCLLDLANNRFLKPSELNIKFKTLDTKGIKKILCDSQHQYWIITFFDGIFLINTNRNSIQQFFTENRTMNDISDIIKDQNGKIIISTNDQLFSFESHKFNLLNTDKIPNLRCLKFYNNQLWIGSKTDGIYILENNKIKKFNAYFPKANLQEEKINCFMEDEQHNLWIGTRGNGLLIFDSSTQTITRLTKMQESKFSIGSNYIISLFQDKQQNIWIGTSGGGFSKYYANNHFLNTLNFAFRDKMIFSVLKDNDNFYAGTQNDGFIKYNSINQSTKVFNSKSSKFPIGTVYQICSTLQDTLFIATENGLVLFEKKSEKLNLLTDKNIPASKSLYTCLVITEKQSVIVSGEGIAQFNYKTKKWTNLFDPYHFLQKHVLVVRHMIRWNTDSILLATENNGLLFYNLPTGKFTEVSNISKLSKTIRFILRNEYTVWLATDDGLIHFDVNSANVLKHITTANGLSGNVIYAIQQDKDSTLYFSTNNGIAMLRHNSNTCIQFNYNFGMSELEFNTAATTADTANQIFYFGGVDGVSLLNTRKISIDSFAPLPILDEVVINGKSYSHDHSLNELNELNLTYKENNISLYFAVNNQRFRGNNNVVYRIKQLDNHWNKLDLTNTLSFVGLKPGKYTIELKSVNAYGIESKTIKSVIITIRPPFYLTFWFIGLGCCCVSFLLYQIYKNKIRKVKEEENNKLQFSKRLYELEMTALRSQLNPHFIFNCMNSIQHSIITEDTDKATIMLHDFASLIRMVLENSAQPDISLENEIKLLDTYLKLEKVRTNNGFDYSIIIAQDLAVDFVKIPNMMIQPFLENAIWHGFKFINYKGKIEISFRQENDLVICEIVDNGVGRAAAAKRSGTDASKRSMAISIISNRIHLINNALTQNKASLQIIDLNENDSGMSGTKIILTLPSL